MLLLLPWQSNDAILVTAHGMSFYPCAPVAIKIPTLEATVDVKKRLEHDATIKHG